jgi:NADH-quinone oxidoreductase subunit J
MNASTIIFYLISAFILVPAYMSVTSMKIFRAAIYLLFSLIGVAALYFYLENNFIAAVQVVVYVGGIVVLILFSVFLTHESGKDMHDPVPRRELFSSLACVCGFFLVLLQIGLHQFGLSSTQGTTPVSGQTESVQNIGLSLLSTSAGGYALPFEVVSILLLAAMVGAIVIAMKAKPDTKTEIPQVK